MLLSRVLRLFSETLFTGTFKLQLEFSQELARGNGLLFETDPKCLSPVFKFSSS